MQVNYNMIKNSLLSKLLTILNKKTYNHKDIGLYISKLEINGVTHKVTSEVELVREYLTGPINEVQIRHNKIIKINKGLEKDAIKILQEEHLLVEPTDVKWN